MYVNVFTGEATTQFPSAMQMARGGVSVLSCSMDFNLGFGLDGSSSNSLNNISFSLMTKILLYFGLLHICSVVEWNKLREKQYQSYQRCAPSQLLKYPF